MNKTRSLPVISIVLVILVLSIFSLFNLMKPSSTTAKDFEILLYQGQEQLQADSIMLKDLRGDLVVLNFWAGLCSTCRAEMPGFDRFYNNHKDKLIFVGVDVGPYIGLGSTADGRRLLSELQVSYPAGFTEDGDVVLDYQILYMPTTLFISQDGEIIKRFEGNVGEDTLDSYLDEIF